MHRLSRVRHLSGSRHGYFAQKLGRGATPALVNEIMMIREKYSVATSIDIEIYNLDRKYTMDLKSDGGRVKRVDDEKNEHLIEERAALTEEKRKTLSDIKLTVDKRMAAMDNDLARVRHRNFMSNARRNKINRKKGYRGSLLYANEIRLLRRNYVELLKELEEEARREYIFKLKTVRMEELDNEYKAERQRDTSSIHNFTNISPDVNVVKLLSKGGGFVSSRGFLSTGGSKEGLRAKISSALEVKKHAEEALLTYVKAVTGERRGGSRLMRHAKVKKGGNKKFYFRRYEIRGYLCHPNLGRRERGFVYKALQVIDRYYIKSLRGVKLHVHAPGISSFNNEGYEKPKALLGACSFSKRPDLVLRESDKNMGWSLNSLGWYKGEYERQLKSGFYQRVGSVDMTGEMIKHCKSKISTILQDHKDIISESERRLLLGVGGEGPIMPSLNLMPKVHKLSEPASPDNEAELRGRPIVTGYGWCTVGGSKLLQKKLQVILGKLKDRMLREGFFSTILNSSKALVESIKEIPVRRIENFMFVTFDFKDLYTNILFEDAQRVIKDCCETFGVGNDELHLILDLYKFCNDCNYFNVGSDLFKQVKGVSMGCYFSKEISDLVLLYSEYLYLRGGYPATLKLFRRYADDGLLIFSDGDDEQVLGEIKRLMGFYPKNLVVNIKLNRNYCQYLDLKLAIDDVSMVRGVVHYQTFFKPLHKFSYVDPKSNHPSFVFKGLIRTECARYYRNSTIKEDYEHAVNLFCMRLLKRGYTMPYIRRHLLSYEQNILRARTAWDKDKEGKLSSVVYTVTFDKASKVVETVESLMRDAQRGSRMSTRLVFSRSVLPKLRNILSTRKLLHAKLKPYTFG